MKILKVGVVGSRRRNAPADKEKIRKALKQLIDKPDVRVHLVSGGCPEGADRFAEELAEEFKIGISIHYPDKESLPDNPQYYDLVKMYYSRNTLIAGECHILISLPASDRKGGTEDTIRKTDVLKKPVVCL